MTRVFIVNRYFAPDESATSQMASALADFLAEGGADVRVLTTDRTYDGRALGGFEKRGGVSIHRIASPAGTRKGLVLRATDYARLYRAFYVAGLKLFDAGDIVIAKTDPPLLSVPISRAAKRKGARLVNWLQDLYPEVGVNLRVPFLAGPVGPALARMRDKSLASAAANVVISEGMRVRVAARLGVTDRIHIIHNWAQDDTILPRDAAESRLRSSCDLAGKFVVGYSGNLGRAHEIVTFLGAARALRSHGEICFLFVGGGRLHDELRSRAQAEGLSERFRFLPFQEQQSLGDSLSAADVHLVSLRPEVEGLIMPSKLYGIAAAGRPVICVAAQDGDVAEFVSSNGCGIVVRPGDGNALAQAIISLERDKGLRVALGARGREAIDTRYAKSIALGKWAALLRSMDRSVR